jgi:hypothetical protein
LRAVEYRNFFEEFFSKYNEKFLWAKKVDFEFRQIINGDLNKFSENEVEFDENSCKIKVIYKIDRRFLPKGKGLSKPSSEDFFIILGKYIRNILIKEDNDRFNTK